MEHHSIMVVGRTWAGYRSAYTYVVRGKLPLNESKTELVKRVAGDFADVEDCRIDRTLITAERMGRTLRRTETTECVYDWRDEASADTHADCTRTGAPLLTC